MADALVFGAFVNEILSYFFSTNIFKKLISKINRGAFFSVEALR